MNNQKYHVPILSVTVGTVVVVILAAVALAATIHVCTFAIRHMGIAKTGEEEGSIIRGFVDSLPFLIACAIWILSIVAAITLALSMRTTGARLVLLGLAAVDLMIAALLFLLRRTAQMI